MNPFFKFTWYIAQVWKRQKIKNLSLTVEAKRLSKNVLRLNRAAFHKMTACCLFTIDGRLPQAFNSLFVEYVFIIFQFALITWLRRNKEHMILLAEEMNKNNQSCVTWDVLDYLLSVFSLFTKYNIILVVTERVGKGVPNIARTDRKRNSWVWGPGFKIKGQAKSHSSSLGVWIYVRLVAIALPHITWVLSITN